MRHSIRYKTNKTKMYTIVGAVLGGVVTFVTCKIMDVKFTSPGLSPSDGGLYVALGTFSGACIGFGLGVGALTNGNHVVLNK